MVGVTAAEHAPGVDAAPARRRGRRPGGADTRGALLNAARAVFAERGFDGATVRLIADRAGVDPAMVNHWFGGKEALFTAALDLPVDPATLIAQVVPGDPERLGERIVSRFLTVWDHAGEDRPDLRAALVASQIVGLGMVRYVLRLEPLASADHPTVIAAVAPTLQRYLTGPLDGTGS